MEEYFPTVPLQHTVLQPFETAKVGKTFDVTVNATGGGTHGQAGAVRLAVSRALIQSDETLAPGIEGRGVPDPRPAHEGTEKERPARRAQTLPVLEALKTGSISPAGICTGSESSPFCF